MLYNNMHTSMLKAQTALQTRQPTSIRDAQLSNDPSGLPRQLVQFGFFTNSGGLPIVVDGEMIGAIGVGGGARGWCLGKSGNGEPKAGFCYPKPFPVHSPQSYRLRMHFLYPSAATRGNLPCTA